MRGKAEDNAPRLRCTGITPAYAGKSGYKEWKAVKG